MKVAALMPINGREPLLDIVLRHLSKQTVPVTALCCGHTDSEEAVCKQNGAEFYRVPDTMPLGCKWQTLIDVVRERPEFDAIMIVGSSNLFSHDWCEKLLPSLKGGGIIIIGVRGLYYVDLHKNGGFRCFFWGGYRNYRYGEPVGSGRLVLRSTLENVEWKAFDRNIWVGCDGSMVRNLKVSPNRQMVCTKEDVITVRVSTWAWGQINCFEKMAHAIQAKHMSNEAALDFVKDFCPELLGLHEKLRKFKK